MPWGVGTLLVAMLLMGTGCGLRVKAHHVFDLDVSIGSECSPIESPITPSIIPDRANPNREHQ
jgi:hypothetical protein